MNTKEKLKFNLYCRNHGEGLTVELVEESCKSTDFEQKLYNNVKKSLNNRNLENVPEPELQNAVYEVLQFMDYCWSPYMCQNPHIELEDVHNRR